MLPQSSTRSRRCCGLVTHAAPVSTSLIHTHPLTSRRRSSEPAPSSGACCTSVQPPAPSAHHWRERRRRRRHREHAAAEDDRRRRRRSRRADRSRGPRSRRRASGIATSRPSVVAATTDAAPPATPGCCRTTGEALPSAPGTATSSGVARSGVASTRSPSGSASTAVSAPSDVIDTTSSVRSTSGLTSVVAVGVEEHDVAGRLVGEHGVAVGRRRRRGRRPRR